MCKHNTTDYLNYFEVKPIKTAAVIKLILTKLNELLCTNDPEARKCRSDLRFGRKTNIFKSLSKKEIYLCVILNSSHFHRKF